MSRTIKFDDPLLVLITDALRAGPGTPQWEEAVTRVRASGDQTDEFQLLYSAREHLAAGREYREVRAGPKFTRKVLEAVEHQEMSAPRSLPTATIFVLLFAVVIIGVVFTVAKLMFPAR